MSLIPDEELKRQSTINLAPMVDFLFLCLALFVAFSLTRTALKDTDLTLVQHPSGSSSQASRTINLSVTEEGQYKWVTDSCVYLMDGLNGVQSELLNIPLDTKVLLHIDRGAKWEPIAQVIFAVRDLGFQIYPVYE